LTNTRGRGSARSCCGTLAAVARSAGLKTFIAEVLAENLPMLRVFEASGLPIQTKRDHPEVVHVTMQLN
jgi:hypothetical protein